QVGIVPRQQVAALPGLGILDQRQQALQLQEGLVTLLAALARPDQPLGAPVGHDPDDYEHEQRQAVAQEDLLGDAHGVVLRCQSPSSRMSMTSRSSRSRAAPSRTTTAAGVTPRTGGAGRSPAWTSPRSSSVTSSTSSTSAT